MITHKRDGIIFQMDFCLWFFDDIVWVPRTIHGTISIVPHTSYDVKLIFMCFWSTTRESLVIHSRVDRIQLSVSFVIDLGKELVPVRAGTVERDRKFTNPFVSMRVYEKFRRTSSRGSASDDTMDTRLVPVSVHQYS